MCDTGSRQTLVTKDSHNAMALEAWRQTHEQTVIWGSKDHCVNCVTDNLSSFVEVKIGCMTLPLHLCLHTLVTNYITKYREMFPFIWWADSKCCFKPHHICSNYKKAAYVHMTTSSDVERVNAKVCIRHHNITKCSSVIMVNIHLLHQIHQCCTAHSLQTDRTARTGS